MDILSILITLFLVPAAIIEGAEIACILAAVAWDWVAGRFRLSL